MSHRHNPDQRYGGAAEHIRFDDDGNASRQRNSRSQGQGSRWSNQDVRNSARSGSSGPSGSSGQYNHPSAQQSRNAQQHQGRGYLRGLNQPQTQQNYYGGQSEGQGYYGEAQSQYGGSQSQYGSVQGQYGGFQGHYRGAQGNTGQWVQTAPSPQGRSRSRSRDPARNNDVPGDNDVPLVQKYDDCELNSVVEDCIERLSEAEEHVCLEKIEELLLKHYKVETLIKLGLRKLDHLQAINQHKRMLCKVNAYIQAFVKSRSIATTHELRECLKDYLESGNHFNDLKLGPLMKMPLVIECFHIPPGCRLIEITTMDILEELKKFLTKHHMWRQQVDVAAFMAHLTEVYRVDSPYELGVRIISVPLVMQVLKKAERERAETMRESISIIKEKTASDISTAFHQSVGSVLDYSTVQCTVREAYRSMDLVEGVELIFSKFTALIESLIYLHRESRMDVLMTVEKQLKKSKAMLDTFVERLIHDKLFCNLFRLAVCLSNDQLQTDIKSVFAEVLKLEQMKKPQDDADGEKKTPPALSKLIQEVKVYLERTFSAGSLNLTHLSIIERKMLETNGYRNFREMKQGTFLQFLLETPAILKFLEEHGSGLSGFISSGSGSTSDTSTFQCNKNDVIRFIKQTELLDPGNLTECEQLSDALCTHYEVKEVKLLHHGNLQSLMNSAGKHTHQNESAVFYQSALCAKTKMEWSGRSMKSGKLGHQERSRVLSCLQNCPMLEDLSIWSHWAFLFQPQYGNLKHFLEKYGYIHVMDVQDNNESCELTTTVCALEVKPGVLIRVDSNSTPAHFNDSTSERNVLETCTHLVSIIASNKGVDKTPLSLLGSNVESALRENVKCDRRDLKSSSDPQSVASAQFVLECLVKLPRILCQAVADKVFLRPLSAVIGQNCSHRLLLELSQDSHPQRTLLQHLGLTHGVHMWSQTVAERWKYPQHCLIKQTAELQDMRRASGRDSDVVVCDDVMSDDNDDVDEDMDVILDEPRSDKPAMPGPSQTESKNDVMVIDDDVIVVEEEEMEETKSEKKRDPEKPDCIVALDITESRQQQQHAYDYINKLRREEFGVGVKLTEDGEKLMEKQQQRLGRSLERLSKDLYSKDTHFVLELIQNADDNTYPSTDTETGEDLVPSVLFLVEPDMISVFNNESGFTDVQVKAVCDVGSSTKPKENAGYIGQKGIGFKSVFRITDRPEIHSRHYHWYFDIHSGPMGYILPHWIPTEQRKKKQKKLTDGKSWTTEICLPLKSDVRHSSVLSVKFQDLHPSLLLFLHRLRKLSIVTKTNTSSVTKQQMTRNDVSKNVIEIVQNNGTNQTINRFLITKKTLDASDISVKAKAGVNISNTEIILAFPIDSLQHKQFAPTQQPVFAYLPLRSYGLKFIVQGDFEVPSSREDINIDSMWNQWLREQIPAIFVQALEVFKSHAQLTSIQAVCCFLQFVPLEDETFDFFRPVARAIMRELMSRPCLPTQTEKSSDTEWKKPSQLVTISDPLIRVILTAELLRSHLGVSLLHDDVARVLSAQMCVNLGIRNLSTQHLMEAGKAIVKNLEVSINEPEMDSNPGNAAVHIVSQWLVCVYRSLDALQDNSAVLQELRQHNMIYLVNGNLVSLKNTAVFYPLNDDEKNPQKRKSQLKALESDLSMLHPSVLSLDNQVQRSQLCDMLTQLGVNKLQPADIINKHIVPTLSLTNEKLLSLKSSDLLQSYVVYLKEELHKDPTLIDISTLHDLVVVSTSDGLKRLSECNVHFHTLYNSKVDVLKALPGYDWLYLSDGYLQFVYKSPTEIQRWFEFFERLGVVDGLVVEKQTLKLDAQQLKTSLWSDYCKSIAVSDSYTIVDYHCKEFESLVKKNTKEDSIVHQMENLYKILSADWMSRYKAFTCTEIVDDSGNVVQRDVETTFAHKLKDLNWLPARVANTCSDLAGRANKAQETVLKKPSTLYLDSPEVNSLLLHHVPYSTIPASSPTQLPAFLGVKFKVTVQQVQESLITWSRQKEFTTSLNHIKTVYTYLHDNLTPKQAQDLVHQHAVIFIPKLSSDSLREGDLVVGMFVGREECWWQEPTGLFSKYQSQGSLGCGKQQINVYYSGMERFFKECARLDQVPSLSEYVSLWVELAENNLQSRVHEDVILMWKFLAQNITSGNMNIDDLKSAVKDMKNSKIFPTLSGRWHCLNSRPMLPDDSQLEKMFAGKPKCNIVDLCLKANQVPQQEPVYQLLHDCGLPRLSDSIDIVPTTENLQFCPSLQRYLHMVIPWLQKLMISEWTSQYEALVKKDVVKMLAKIKCYTVGKLELVHSLISSREIVVILNEHCRLHENRLYIHKDSLNDYKVVNKELSRYFADNDRNIARHIRPFLSEVLPLLERSSRDLDAFIQNEGIKDLPEGEELWVVAPPTEAEILAEQHPAISAQHQTDSSQTALSSAGEGSSAMKCWPPGNPDDPKYSQTRSWDPSRSRSTSDQRWPPPNSATPTYTDHAKLPADIIVHRVDERERDDKDYSVPLIVSKIPKGGETNPIDIDMDSPIQIIDSPPPPGTETSQEPCGSDRTASRIRGTPGTQSSTSEQRPSKRVRIESGQSNADQETNMHQSADLWTTWTREPEELVYEDVNFNASEFKDVVMKPTDTHDRQIGRWGEELVNKYLRDEMLRPKSGILDVNWLQANMEQGTPYEFIVTVKDNPDASDATSPVTPRRIYIEVKTTRSQQKSYFPISLNQVKFAVEQQESYHLYRVFGGGSARNAKLTKITNLAQRLENKHVGLLMYL